MNPCSLDHPYIIRGMKRAWLIKVEFTPIDCDYRQKLMKNSVVFACFAKFSESWTGYLVSEDAEKVDVCSRRDPANVTQFLGLPHAEALKSEFEIRPTLNSNVSCSDIKAVAKCFDKLIRGDLRFTFLFHDDSRFLNVLPAIDIDHQGLHYLDSSCKQLEEDPIYHATTSFCTMRLIAEGFANVTLIKVQAMTRGAVDIGCLTRCLDDYSEDWDVYRVKDNAQNVTICSTHEIDDMEQIVGANLSILEQGFSNTSIPLQNGMKNPMFWQVAFFVLTGLLGFIICAALLVGAVWKFVRASDVGLGAQGSDGGLNQEMPMTG